MKIFTQSSLISYFVPIIPASLSNKENCKFNGLAVATSQTHTIQPNSSKFQLSLKDGSRTVFSQRKEMISSKRYGKRIGIFSHWNGCGVLLLLVLISTFLGSPASASPASSVGRQRVKRAARTNRSPHKELEVFMKTPGAYVSITGLFKFTIV